MRTSSSFWRAVLGSAGVFLGVLALLKAVSFREFAGDVTNYRIVPRGFEPLISRSILALEMLTSIGLLLRRTHRRAGFLAIALVGFFTLVIGVSILNDLDISCGCMPKLGSAARIGPGLLLRNLLLILLVGAALAGTSSRGFEDLHLRVARRLRGHAVLTVMSVVLVAAVAELLMLAQMNQLLRLELGNHTGAGIATLKAGEHAPSFDIVGLEDPSASPVRVEFRQPTKLFVFSTGCPYCREMMALWNATYRLEQGSFRFIGLSTSSEPETARFVQEVGIEFPVFVPHALHAFLDTFGMIVPQTIEIDAEGVVVANILGIPAERSAAPSR